VSVALAIQQEMRMPYIILSFVACPALQYFFPHYLINGTTFGGGGGIIDNKMCVLIFCTTFVWNISHSKKNWVRYVQKTSIGLHVKYRLFLSDFNETWIFSADFSTIFKCQISWKSVEWETRYFMLTDGQTDIMILIVTFRNFANAPTNCFPMHYISLVLRIATDTELLQHQNGQLGQKGHAKIWGESMEKQTEYG
jgi:hypothetical protein